MKKCLSLFFLCLSAATFSFAQTIQWASEVIHVSSEYEKDYPVYYSAKQALGVPNALMNAQLVYMAWSPKTEDSSFGEHIHLGFKTPMKIQQVAVAESLNPGAIIRIWAFDKDGKRHKIYENKQPKAAGGVRGARIFRHKLEELTEYYVKEIKIELHTGAVKGRNQIDAVAISDEAKDIRPKVSVLKYADEVAPPENLGKAINSSYPERLPIISSDGQTLFFTRKDHPKNVGEENKDDIWVAYREEDDTWSNAVNIGTPLNNEEHNFVVATNPMGTTLYLGNDYKKKDEGMSIAKKKGRTWSEPKAVEIEDHYNDSPFVSYHLNTDGDILLMSVERKEGAGDRDFYVCFKKRNGSWSKPQSLGLTINTVGAENSIFLAADNRTIYFSSNGHPGYGGFDMFISRRLDNTWTKWTKPKNLGKKINTNNNDFNYTIPASGEYAYFASGSMEDSDLFRIKLPKEVQPKPVALVKTRIVDAETGESLDGKLNIQPVGKKSKKVKKSDGEAQIILPFGDNVALHAVKEGYFSISENVALGGEKLKELDGKKPKKKEKEVAAPNGAADELQLELKELKKDLATIEKARTKKPKAPSKKKPKKDTESELERMKNKFNDLSDSDDKAEAVADAPSSGDDELDELQRKFNQHFEKKTEPNKPPKKTQSTPKPVKKDTVEDEELAEMKRRFNEHHNKKEDQTETAASDTPATQTTPTTTKPQPDFESYKEAVRADLVAEMTPEIKEELHDELYAEAKRDLDSGLRKQLEPEMEKEIRTQLRKNLEEEVRNELRNEKQSEVEAEVREELRDEVENDLRAKLSKEIEAELREELAETVKEEVQREMEYAVKKDLEEKLREEIQAQLKAQTKAEKEAAKEKIAAKEEEEETEEETEPGEPAYKEVEKEIVLVPIKVGQVIPMNNIFFEANQSKIKDASFTELDRVLGFLKENPTLVVEVSGHTNGWCSHEFAHELSTDRSKIVMNYFLAHGIPAKRIQNRGYGKTNPVETNDTRAGRSKNQRVELKILEIL